MMRVGVFGLGGVAERIHLPACRNIPEIEIVGACEPHAETRARMAREFRLPHVYEDAETLLREQEPDLVVVGTPPDSHFALCRSALEAGAHVFCEKPFVSSLEEADNLLAVAKQAGRGLRVNNQYRYMPIYRRTRERLDAGDFGRLFYVQCWQQMFHPPQQEKVAWRAALKRSTLFEFGTHAIDLICYLFDAFPESVTAHIPKVRPEFDSDVLVHLTMRFPGERLAAVSLNRVSHAPEKYLEMRLDCEQASLRLSLGGVARAAVEWSRRRGGPAARFSLVKGGEARAESGGRSKAYVKETQPAFMSATAAHLREFLKGISSGAIDYGPAEHARDVLGIVFAAYESAEAGETVALEPEGRAGG